MDLQLNGKDALLTGSSKGIGEAVAKGLAQEGATVVVHGRDKNATEQVKEQIVSAGGDAHCVTGDLTLEKDVAALVAEAQRLGGAIGGSKPETAGFLSTSGNNMLACKRRGNPSQILQ